MDLGLQGKHAIVTGGSRGIGKAIARELAREGVDVAIVARTQADLEATARELATATNRRILPLAADVTSKEQVERVVAEAARELGGLHILVNSGSHPGGSTTSRPRSGRPWWPTIWCCSPASNWHSRPTFALLQKSAKSVWPALLATRFPWPLPLPKRERVSAPAATAPSPARRHP